jgi:hypothetical protein
LVVTVTTATQTIGSDAGSSNVTMVIWRLEMGGDGW